MTEPVAGFPGDNKDSANGDAAGLSFKKSAATRMVTRLRNPDSKLSQLKSQQVAAAVHEANKGFKEGKEVRGTVRPFNACVLAMSLFVLTVIFFFNWFGKRFKKKKKKKKRNRW